MNATTVPSSGTKTVGPALDTTVELARCFLRLANLPNLALDRLSRYEATLWRQAGRVSKAITQATVAPHVKSQRSISRRKKFWRV
jgi:hypothetical protein